MLLIHKIIMYVTYYYTKRIAELYVKILLTLLNKALEYIHLKVYNEVITCFIILHCIKKFNKWLKNKKFNLFLMFNHHINVTQYFPKLSAINKHEYWSIQT